jgi:hypothetical protein
MPGMLVKTTASQLQLAVEGFKYRDVWQIRRLPLSAAN